MVFENKIKSTIDTFKNVLECESSSDWSLKGFIDFYENVYPISNDTKVISKIIELMIFPILSNFAKDNDLELKLSEHQNHYPDMTFVDSDNKKYAVDIKSTYRKSKTEVNGMTLGAFTGYFRDRYNNKNTLYPYNDYEKHYVLGIIYSRSEESIDETKSYNFSNFKDMKSVINSFEFFFQEKWKIASDKPGSGNTKNIGSIKNIEKIKNGNGLFNEKFASDGEKKFDSYWQNYQTKDMAKNNEIESPPYNDIESFNNWVSDL